ncbi:hypothetical protein GF327_04815 [Candidatus Woesearchaeota archaeon]|nr:hypothetical protein [Candidatus Woesearchaeota archaeon]
MNLQCIHCAGKGLCGRPFCPLQKKISSQKKINKVFKKDFFGSAPNVFVGRVGYPKVNVGVLSNEDVREEHDNPQMWSSKNYQIPKLIDLRSSLVNSRFRMDIKDFDDKLLEMTKEVSQTPEKVDVEINLNKKPRFRLSYNQQAAPFGPSVRLKKAEITENPKIPRQVDKVVSEDDWKAVDAMDYLYKKGYGEHFLTKLISVGNIGVKENRKLVPTRWSITATDDILGKKLISEIKDYQKYDYTANFGSYLGNHYLILFFPEIWSYELFETLTENGESATDFEGYEGRKNYASNTVGGYYAARLGILEHLKNRKRQASVLCLRFITNDYWAPLGVWVVRQATRKALESKPLEFSSMDLMIKYAKLFVKKKFDFDLDNLLRRSVLIKEIKEQKKLDQFI